ncbi:homoserine O-acetyltransferase family protein [Pseudopedobacter beijingensis]|uniref:Homoserine O-acetyltransferase n=1 Tax=Pseudopedobacter beijingensis TaxID=1207056 RepID=A0ABW4IGQ0_9SPHI
MNFKTYQHKGVFELENGKGIADLEIAYHTYGELNKEKNNVVWVCHALTANSDVFDWWKGLFGQTDFFNPKDFFIVCANIIGSPYGSSNPLSISKNTDLPYFLVFPQFSIRDMVNAHQILAQQLGIHNIDILIGGSLGGQQALEWAVMEPQKIKNLIVMATNAVHSPWGIAFNESQRLAIETDPSFFSNQINGGLKGLKTARSIALLSYRTASSYNKTQSEQDLNKVDNFRASSYQNYQGDKLVKRFNAYSYYYLTKAMDSHNLGRNRDSITDALNTIKANTLVIGIASDILFPPDEQQYIAKYIHNAEYHEIESLYGHDGFLLEIKQLNSIISNFIKATTLETDHKNLQIA